MWTRTYRMPLTDKSDCHTDKHISCGLLPIPPSVFVLWSVRNGTTVQPAIGIIQTPDLNTQATYEKDLLDRIPLFERITRCIAVPLENDCGHHHLLHECRFMEIPIGIH